MISIGNDNKIRVGWRQNGIKNHRKFRSMKEAERFQELVEDVQNSIRLCEEMDKFNRNFDYDPQVLNLKLEHVGKEIEELKNRLRIKQTLQKKLGDAVQKLADQPRNVIDSKTFFKEVKQIKIEINRLDRFFREHKIVELHMALMDAVREMKQYFQYQKDMVRVNQKNFDDLRKDLLKKFTSITTRDKVLTMTEVMKYMSVSRSTVMNMMYGGGLPFLKVGNRYRVKERDLENWIEKRKETLRR